MLFWAYFVIINVSRHFVLLSSLVKVSGLTILVLSLFIVIIVIIELY